MNLCIWENVIMLVPVTVQQLVCTGLCSAQYDLYVWSLDQIYGTLQITHTFVATDIFDSCVAAMS